MTKSKTTPAPAATKDRKRRSPDQIVADLEAKIARVREREATKTLRADPAIKLTSLAARALNKALREAKEPELVEALTAARGALAGYLEAKGLTVPAPGKKCKETATAA